MSTGKFFLVADSTLTLFRVEPALYVPRVAQDDGFETELEAVEGLIRAYDVAKGIIRKKRELAVTRRWRLKQKAVAAQQISLHSSE